MNKQPELIHAEMVTRFSCPECETPNEVKYDARGQTLECEFCDCEVVISCSLEYVQTN